MKAIEAPRFRSDKKGLLRHCEDRLNLWRAFTGLPLLLLPAITGMPSGWVGIFYGATVWFLLNDMNFVLHQHVHYPLTTSSRLNRVLDILMSCVTGMSAYNWRQHHLLRHHKKDDAWSGDAFLAGKRYSWLGSIVYSVYPLVEALVKGAIGGKTAPFNFRAAFFEQMAIVAIMTTLIVRTPEFYSWYYFLVYFFTAKTDYDNHVGCDESDFGFSNNTVNPIYNEVRNNFGYHTAHLYFPGAHWTKLPLLHGRIVAKIPSARIEHRWWTGSLSPPLLFHLLQNLGRSLRFGLLRKIRYEVRG